MGRGGTATWLLREDDGFPSPFGGGVRGEGRQSYTAAMPSALLIIAPEGFQDQEYAGTRKGLEDARYAITVASTRVGTCTGKFGGKQEATVALKGVDISSFDKVAFIGGPGAAALADNEDAKQIARETVAQGKILGAICIAPLILARAGVLKGKHATVWDPSTRSASGLARSGQVAPPTPSQILQEEGATYTGKDVTVDGKIVTGNGPATAEKFGKVLAGL